MEDRVLLGVGANQAAIVFKRQQAEMALADARSRLDAALDVGAVATWTWDIPSNRLFADTNLARVFNLPPSEADGGLLDKYIAAIHPDDQQKVMGALHRSSESGDDYEAEYRILQADGSVRWVIARGRIQRDATDRPVRMPGVLVDITERKGLEAELQIRLEELAEGNRRKEELLASLREADRRKDEFLAILAHELRNPLAPIRNSLEILKAPRLDGALLQKTREVMERQVHHLVRLVGDLLDVARVTQDKIELKKEPVELASVIAQAVETVQSLIEFRGHRLEWALPHEPLVVDADPVRMAQIVGNLLTNSAKYTEANGHIWLSAERDGKEAVLRVRDDGIGIAPDMLPNIFDLFMQASPGAENVQGGLGVGLTLVKKLVQMHGGTVEARSAGLGEGCEFSIRLPIVVEQRRELAAQRHGEPDAKVPSSRHRLLVVDDNEDAALSLAILLRMQGHEVRVAHDGPSALAVAKSFLPKMVFLDIGMPGMDGYEVARHMRLQPGLETVVLAALTGWGLAEDRRRTALEGFDHHIVKPADPQLLERLLEDVKPFTLP